MQSLVYCSQHSNYWQYSVFLSNPRISEDSSQRHSEDGAMNFSAGLSPLTRLGNRLTRANEAPRTSALAAAHELAFLNWRMPAFLVAALYLILPNLPLLFSTHGLGASPHGYINLEYLLIGAVGVFLPRSVVFLLLCLESLADFAYSICYTYQFSLRDLLSSVRYVLVLPKDRELEAIAFLALILLVCATLAFLQPPPQKRLWTVGALLVLVAVLTPIDVLGGQNPVWHKDMALIGYRVARSPVLTLVWREVKASHTNVESQNAEDTPMSSASSGVTSLLTGSPSGSGSPNVVLIVVESWGLLLDAHLAQALAAPYDDPRIVRKYKVSYGAVPFAGLTVPGEARELCHSTVGFGIIHVSAKQAEQCLPAFFHARGYQDLAIHGYVGQMFYRDTWYSKLGFDRTWFEPELTKAGLPSCRGAFSGICDASIANWIGSSLLSLDQAKPRFIYWVTLNSHLPVPGHPDLPDDGVCATQPALQNSAPLCSWFRLVRAVHQSVQQAALGTTARPTVFILVGDHAPPFADSQLQADFSSTQVPYAMLTPLDISSGSLK